MTVATSDMANRLRDQTNSTGRPPAPDVDYKSFLKLLIAEMKNQDPTKPMDSTQYVAQLATFSQVEQTVQTNTKLDQLLQTSALSQAGAIIGHTMISADGNDDRHGLLGAPHHRAGWWPCSRTARRSTIGAAWRYKLTALMNEADALDIVQ